MADTPEPSAEPTPKAAQRHARLAIRYDRAAVYWDEHGDHEQAEVERANARLERGQADLVGNPKQKTQPVKGEPVEIPIPTRDAFLRNLEKVAPPIEHVESVDN